MSLITSQIIRKMTKDRFGNSVELFYKETAKKGWYLLEQHDKSETFIGRNKIEAHAFLLKIPKKKGLFNLNGLFSKLVGVK